jgi:hypothetical protein
MTTPEQASTDILDLYNFSLGSSTTAVVVGRANHEAKDATDGEGSGRVASEEIKDVETSRKSKTISNPSMKETKKVASKRIANRG